jgi:predicted NBD/HSP70 family sugar kinase
LRLLAEYLMTVDSVQRPTLARQIGLPRHAVSDLLAILEGRGLIRVSGDLDGSPGRSQLTYSLRSSAALSLGFDVGGTKLAGALCDIRGTILAEHTIPTARTGAADLIEQIATMADALCREAGLPRFHVRNTAIGVPAAVDCRSGTLSLSGNLPGIEGAFFSQKLPEVLGGAVHLDNDVNLALLAELADGVARGRRNVIFISLGTGIGGAMMVNGHLLRGSAGGAGEIGYMPLWQLERTGLPPVEEKVGEAGIRRRYVAAGGDPAHSVFDIFEASAHGSESARSALDATAGIVARSLVAALSLVDADMVVFGGSIGARAEFIERVQMHVSGAWMRPVEILGSRAGGRGGLLGAIELSRQNMLETLFGPPPSLHERRS